MNMFAGNAAGIYDTINVSDNNGLNWHMDVNLNVSNSNKKATRSGIGLAADRRNRKMNCIMRKEISGCVISCQPMNSIYNLLPNNSKTKTVS